MKNISCIAALLLGVAFIFFGVHFWAHFGFVPKPEHSKEAGEMIGAMYASGYLRFVKVLEILGGILLILPRTRVWGLFIIGPILVNILCIGFFLDGKTDGLVIVLTILALIVAYSKRCALCCVNTCGCSSGCGCGTTGGCGCSSSDKPASTGCCGGK
jgi:putative oxidoreductase